MKRKYFILIIATFVLLGVLGILMTPKRLTEEETKKANENQQEILKTIPHEDWEITTPAEKKDTISKDSSHIHTSVMPRPTDVYASMEKEEGDHHAFEEYMNTIHKAAPGVNWKVVNENNSEQRYFNDLMNRANRSHTDTLADGKLIGWWQEKGSMNNAGRTLFAEPDTLGGYIYIGSDAGNIWKGKPDGSDWKSLNDPKRFGGLRMLRLLTQPNGKQRIVVVTDGNKSWYSDDNGDSWNKASGLDNIEKWGNIEHALMCNDSLHTIFVLAHDWDYNNWGGRVALYKSLDRGTTFSIDTAFRDDVFGGPDKFHIWTSYYGSGKLYIIADSLVMVKDSQNLAPQLKGTINRSVKGRTYIAGVETGNATTLYAFIEKNIYRSTDAGSNWTFQSNISHYPTHGTFYCGLTNPDFIALGEVNCYISNDGGVNFNEVNGWADYYQDIGHKLHADIQSVQAFYDQSGSEYFYINTDGGTYRSDDELQTVQNISTDGLNIGQYYSVYTCKPRSDYIYAGAQDQGFQLCNEDSGNLLYFKQVISGDYGHIVSSDSGYTIWMNYPGFAACYPDITSDTKHYDWNFTCQGQVWIPPMMADPDDPFVCWLGGGSDQNSGAHLYKLTYSSGPKKVNYQEQSFNFGSKSDRISAMSAAPFDHQLRFVLTDKGRFHISKDGGNSWNYILGFKGPGAQYLYGASIIFAGNVLCIGGSGYSNPGFWMSMDTGKTFSPYATGLPGTMIYELTANEDGSQVYAATDNGPYMFSVADTTWYRIGGKEAPDQTFWSVEYIPRTQIIRYGTYGRGIWDFHVGQQLSNTGVITAEVPTNSLKVFPVPAATQIQITYTTLESGKGQLSLIDMQGKVCISKQVQFVDGNNQWIVPLQGIAAGDYTVSLQSKNEIVRMKIQVIN